MEHKFSKFLNTDFIYVDEGESNINLKCTFEIITNISNSNTLAETKNKPANELKYTSPSHELADGMQFMFQLNLLLQISSTIASIFFAF